MRHWIVALMILPILAVLAPELSLWRREITRIGTT